MAPAYQRGAHEEESFHRRADGRDPAGSRQGTRSRGRQEAQGQAQAIYTWRRRFGKLQPADVRRLRHLEIENAKLKRLIAERDLEIDTMKEINRRKW